MVKYLKKKKLYELVEKLLKDKKLPLMKECQYRFYHGVEWLSFVGVGDDENWYKVASQCNGNWINIEEFGYIDEESEPVVIRSDIYADLQNGVYKYHSANQYVS